MNIYIIGIIIFTLVLIVSIILLIYFIKDEKKLKEVTNDDLVKMNKVYTKDEIEEKMFEQYSNILLNIQYDNYAFLKDSVSDDIYNQILREIKNHQDKQEKKIVKDIKKEFCGLISLTQVNDLEVAKYWGRYSNIEYVVSNRKQMLSNGTEEIVETVVEGNKDIPITYEYILTFVKNKSQNENVVCPNCGYQTHMLTSSHCIRCDLEIVPKRMHWVYTGKVLTNISKQK